MQLRLTPGVTSQISLQVTLVEHPSVTLTTPTFSFQGGAHLVFRCSTNVRLDVQVAPERQQHINILNELRQLNLEVLDIFHILTVISSRAL